MRDINTEKALDFDEQSQIYAKIKKSFEIR